MLFICCVNVVFVGKQDVEFSSSPSHSILMTITLLSFGPKKKLEPNYRIKNRKNRSIERMGSGALHPAPEFISFEEFQKARKIVDAHGDLDNVLLLGKIREALESPEVDSVEPPTVVLAMKSPKAAGRQTPKAGAGGVFFNQQEEEVG